MSSLNLSPNKTIMAIQAAIFLANFVVVKKLLLEPYLKVIAKRAQATIGSQSQAEQLELQSRKAADAIRLRLDEVRLEIRTFIDSNQAVAKQQRDEILQRASREANQIVASIRDVLNQDLAIQRQAVPDAVKQLSQQFFDTLVPA